MEVITTGITAGRGNWEMALGPNHLSQSGHFLHGRIHHLRCGLESLPYRGHFSGWGFWAGSGCEFFFTKVTSMEKQEGLYRPMEQILSNWLDSVLEFGSSKCILVFQKGVAINVHSSALLWMTASPLSSLLHSEGLVFFSLSRSFSVSFYLSVSLFVLWNKCKPFTLSLASHVKENGPQQILKFVSLQSLQQLPKSCMFLWLMSLASNCTFKTNSTDRKSTRLNSSHL